MSSVSVLSEDNSAAGYPFRQTQRVSSTHSVSLPNVRFVFSDRLASVKISVSRFVLNTQRSRNVCWNELWMQDDNNCDAFCCQAGLCGKLHLNVENMTLQYGACCSLISMHFRALFDSCFIEQINWQLTVVETVLVKLLWNCSSRATNYNYSQAVLLKM